mmetsp:Transcript_29934/g.41440  ORF Transcript_29934/g.41440 Transcript_29934/m.41440 type:complete len:647 (+) Transcript_29934:91-2031(+)|eukprot:CAMPEP_0196581038 /NCGR_PEP_ID=MMETSP1081-20130531/32050_1 /TAXON_ID=36882 /ORGANISM="Pyramimonas amylifera, Strain CCMP720" /LENGTH=646 /DNA_ID=CAMNT_0041901119 /DNA_START=87 /DNA_END=2027 /DNA_ORIENTATION=-
MAMEKRGQLASSLSKVELEQAIATATVAVMEAISLPKKSNVNDTTVSRPVALAQMVLMGYNLEQADLALKEAGQNDVESALRVLESKPRPPRAFVSADKTPAFIHKPLSMSSSAHPPVSVSQKPVVSERYIVPSSFTLDSLPPHQTQPENEAPNEKTAASVFDTALLIGNYCVKNPALLQRANLQAFNLLVKLLDHKVNQDPEVMLLTLQALSRLVHLRDLHARRLVSLGGLGQLLAMMGLHNDEVRLAGECLTLAFHLTRSRSAGPHLKSHPEAQSGNFAVSIMTALKKFTNDPQVQEMGCACLWSQVANLPAMQRLVINFDVVPNLLRAMEYHRGSEAVIFRICGCLLATAINNPLTQEKLAQMKVREAVREALVQHPGIGFAGQFESLKSWMRPASGNTSVSQDSGRSTPSTFPTTASSAVSKSPPAVAHQSQLAEVKEDDLAELVLLLESPDAQAAPPVGILAKLVVLSDAEPTRVLQAGALEASLSAMRAHPACEPLQLAGCSVISSVKLSLPLGCAQRLACVRALLPLLKWPRMVVQASTVLWGLSSGDPSVQAAVVNEGGVEALMQACNAHMETQVAVTAAVGALLATALGNLETQSVMAQKGASVVVRKVLSAHKTINFNGEFDELRSWLKAAKSQKA